MTEIPSQPPARDPKASILGAFADLPWLPAIASSLGAVGLLTGMGYVVQDSRDSLLGINLITNRPTADYVALGGRFLLDAVASTWVHWVIALAGVAVIVLGGILADFALYRPMGVHAARTVWMLALVTLTILYVVKSRRFDLPYVRMSDLLEKPPVCETNPSRQEHDIWERFLCSRDDHTLLNLMRSKVGVDCSVVPGGVAILPKDITTARPPVGAGAAAVLKQQLHSRLTIDQEFTVNIFGTALVMYLALVLCIAPGLRTVSTLTATLLRIILLAMVVVNATTLPVVYGKVILPTRFPSGRIMYDGILASPQNPRILQASPRNRACLILASDDKFVTFYDVEDNVFVQVKREKVYFIDADETADLVATRISYYLQNSLCGGS